MMNTHMYAKFGITLYIGITIRNIYIVRTALFSYVIFLQSYHVVILSLFTIYYIICWNVVCHVVFQVD